MFYQWYYDPDIKRYINADTYKGEINKSVTLNNYAYANGNPVTLTDPFGKCADDDNYTKRFYKKYSWNSYIPIWGFGWTLGEGLNSIFSQLNGGPSYIDPSEWQQRMIASSLNFLSLLSGLAAADVTAAGSAAGSEAEAEAEAEADVEADVEAEAEAAETSYEESSAFANTSKFSDYIFKEGATHGKDAVFRSLGYGKEDSETLASIYEQQAASKYANGLYTLGKADSYGQRINIEIELQGIGESAGKTSYINSGWMIRPDGSITLNTPFSGFTR